MAVNLTIYGRLDGLNDYVLACRTNRYSGANMKRRNEDVIKSHILTQIPRERLKGKVHIHFAWYEPNKKETSTTLRLPRSLSLTPWWPLGLSRQTDGVVLLGLQTVSL